MTEYGRGSGSQPWHPEDPLYGDQSWDGRQYEPQAGWQEDGGQAGSYGDAYSPQGGYATQDGYGATAGYGDGYGNGYAEDGYGYGGEAYGTGGHGAQDGYHTGQFPAYGHQETPGQGGYPDTGLHDTGHQHPVPPGGEPYGHHAPQGPYAAGGQQGEARDASGWQPSSPDGQYAPGSPDDPYASRQSVADASSPPSGRGSGLPRPGPDPETGWDPGADQGESAFFRDDAEDDDTDRGRDSGDAANGGGRGGRKRGGGAKRRSGGACLIVILLLGGILGAAGWFGYRFYQSHFAAAPDFSGEGRGTVQVEIAEGSSVTDMAAALKKAGVVKSVGAFTEASAEGGNKAQTIQPGVYTLRKEMSGQAAIDMMLDPASQSTLIVPEGLRASKVFALIDQRTGSKKGATAKAAKSADLGLPKWADGDVEGFLYPSRYSVTEESDPADVLRKMVDRAETQYKKAGLEGKAGRLGLDSPRDVLTVASLVQAEGKYKHDFEKVARVVYNRLKPGNTETNGYLQFDSTYNYAKNQSTLDVPSPSRMARFDHPYNTYAKKGLPPGPINSPGAEAMNAAIHPADGDWYYFVSVTEDNTVFSDTYEEHQKNVRKYEEAKE